MPGPYRGAAMFRRDQERAAPGAYQLVYDPSGRDMPPRFPG